MKEIEILFGSGKDLNCLQMTDRGVTIFLISLLLIRISGRRSFGIRTPLDNIIVILLGALLSRAVVGASPFVPIIACSFAIVLLHRVFGWLIAHNKAFGRLLEGDRITLFENNAFRKSNMSRALVCEEDIKQGVRKSALTEDMSKIETVYMERNGEISTIKKRQD
jgi:uncharacterized membrane protein YcaP (DUF421 family)